MGPAAGPLLRNGINPPWEDLLFGCGHSFPTASCASNDPGLGILFHNYFALVTPHLFLVYRLPLAQFWFRPWGKENLHRLLLFG